MRASCRVKPVRASRGHGLVVVNGVWPHSRARGRRGCPRIVRVAFEVASVPDACRARCQRQAGRRDCHARHLCARVRGAVSGSRCVHCKTVISWDCVCVWTFDSPTAAPAADQPTSLSAPLGRPALTLRAPYPPAHIFDTTSTSPASRVPD